MKLWESYFRLWDKLSGSLTERETQSLHGKTTEMKETLQDEDRGRDYYGYLCDEGVCIESGV